MTKEQEIEMLKQRVSASKQLGEEEQKRVLEEIKSGKTSDFHTGYPSIDRPWQQFFDMNEYYSINNDKTVYQDILSQNQPYMDDVGVIYLGGKITYQELFKQIDRTAKSLEEYGIKKGDFVTVCCAGIPECIYTVYALAKIGAVANLMAPYFDPKQMGERIADCGSKHLIVLDSFYPKIKDTIKNTSIENVIVVPALNSSPLRFLPKKKEAKLDFDHEIWWNQFIKDGKRRDVPATMDYEKNYPFCMVYSSGTTGPSKAIVLSHDSFQNSVLSYNANTIDLNRGQKLYQIVPPWYSTGLSTSVHLPLHSGIIVFQDPRFERDVFVKNIIDHQLEYAIGSTSLYEGFLDDNLTAGKKLPNFHYPIQGGEALNHDMKKKFEDKFREMGKDTKMIVAYGQCECGAQVTSQSQKVDHPADSVGIPIPGVTVKIVDDNFQELPYGQRGQIVVDTPCGMLGYYHKPEATEKYFHVDEFGVKWSCTGDIGSMGEKGDLFVDGRAGDYSMVDGKKVYNFDVENALRGEEDIEMYDCVSMIRDGVENGFALHIIFTEQKRKEFEEDIEKLYTRLRELQETIFNNTHDLDMVPTEFKIRTSFPFKQFGKRDVEAMKLEQDGFIHIDKDHLSKASGKVLKKI